MPWPLLRNVPADSFEVRIEPHLDDEAELTVAASSEATRRARQAAEEARRLQRHAATTLLTRYGLTVPDTGLLLHVSPQRVSQLAHNSTAVEHSTPPTRAPSRRKAGWPRLHERVVCR